jgi:choline dehydrogenase-like flavoprotein
MSKDGAITILQGRAVGGTTLINWTSSFRTPPQTLEHWAREHRQGPGRPRWRPGSSAWSSAWASPPGGAAQRQQRRAAPWLRTARLPLGGDPAQRARLLEPGLLRHGLPGQRQAIDAGHAIPPPSKRAASCCTWPAPSASHNGERITTCNARPWTPGVHPTGRQVTCARHYVLAGGGINSPALLLRSAPDPHGRLGKRTFLHLVNFSAARFADRIDPYYGAPQSIYSDHFQWQGGTTGRSATSSKCRRCTRPWPAPCSAATARTTPCAWPSCRTPM